MRKTSPPSPRAIIAFAIAAALSLLGCHQSLLAQATVSLIARQPIPHDLAAWQQDRTLFRVIITLSPGTPAQNNARLVFQLRDLDRNRTIASSRAGATAGRPFSLPVGPSTTIRSGADLFDAAAIDVNADVQFQVATTGFFPEGAYELCVALLAGDGSRIIENGLEWDACTTFGMVIPDPPVLISPFDGAHLEGNPNPLFTWTPVVSRASGGLRYSLRVAPMYDGQNSRFAIDNNRPALELAGLTGTSALYPPTAPPLSFFSDATGFAWQVQVLDIFGRPASRNSGKSEIFTFRFQPEKRFDDSIGGVNTGGGRRSTPWFSAGTSTQRDSAELSDRGAGRTVTVRFIECGSFQIAATEKISCAGTCEVSGSGEVAIGYLERPVPVSFTNLRVRVVSDSSAELLYGEAVSATGFGGIVRSEGIQATLSRFVFSPEAAYAQIAFRMREIPLLPGMVHTFTKDRVELRPDRTSLMSIPLSLSKSGSSFGVGNGLDVRSDSIEIGIVANAPERITGRIIGAVVLSGLLDNGRPVTLPYTLSIEQSQQQESLLFDLRTEVKNLTLTKTGNIVTASRFLIDLSGSTNFAAVQTSSQCLFESSWSKPSWRGMIIPDLTSALPIKGGKLDYRASNVVVDLLDQGYVLSFRTTFTKRQSVELGYLRIEIDTVQLAMCQNTVQESVIIGQLLHSAFSTPPSGSTDTLTLKGTLTDGYTLGAMINERSVGMRTLSGGIGLHYGVGFLRAQKSSDYSVLFSNVTLQGLGVANGKASLSLSSRESPRFNVGREKPLIGMHGGYLRVDKLDLPVGDKPAIKVSGSFLAISESGLTNRERGIPFNGLRLYIRPGLAGVSDTSIFDLELGDLWKAEVRTMLRVLDTGRIEIEGTADLDSRVLRCTVTGASFRAQTSSKASWWTIHGAARFRGASLPNTQLRAEAVAFAAQWNRPPVVAFRSFFDSLSQGFNDIFPGDALTTKGTDNAVPAFVLQGLFSLPGKSGWATLQLQSGLVNPSDKVEATANLLFPTLVANPNSTLSGTYQPNQSPALSLSGTTEFAIPGSGQSEALTRGHFSASSSEITFEIGRLEAGYKSSGQNKLIQRASIALEDARVVYRDGRFQFGSGLLIGFDAAQNAAIEIGVKDVSPTCANLEVLSDKEESVSLHVRYSGRSIGTVYKDLFECSPGMPLIGRSGSGLLAATCKDVAGMPTTVDAIAHVTARNRYTLSWTQKPGFQGSSIVVPRQELLGTTVDLRSSFQSPAAVIISGIEPQAGCPEQSPGGSTSQSTMQQCDLISAMERRDVSTVVFHVRGVSDQSASSNVPFHLETQDHAGRWHAVPEEAFAVSGVGTLRTLIWLPIASEAYRAIRVVPGEDYIDTNPTNNCISLDGDVCN